MIVGLMGDTHQDFMATEQAIKVFEEHGVRKVLHVGDFGFGGDTRGINYLNHVHEKAFAAGLKIYVTPGNHEDYTFLKSVFSAHDAQKWAKVRGNVVVAPRGLRWNWDGRSFVSLGGAGSVDRMWRLNFAAQTGKSHWWRAEEITDEDVRTTITPGHADVMITHEAPYYRAVDARIAGNPHGFPQIDLEWADWNRQNLHRAALAIIPKLLVHGHHHFFANSLHSWNENGISELSRILSLNKEMDPGSLALLDTADLSIEMLN